MKPSEARDLFPITATRAYLFSGGLAPAAIPVKAALDRWSDLWAADPAYLYAHYDEEWHSTRAAFARLIGADPSEVAITDNTSRGSNLIVQMIEARSGRNVVVDDYTYPSSVYPWILPSRSGVEVRRVRAREGRVRRDDLARAVDERTVAVSVSHVSPLTGFRHDLSPIAEIAHASGAYLIVDAAQSAGVVDLDVRREGVDFLTCCAMKWLLGTPGLGFLFVAREHADRLPQPQAGHAGVLPWVDDEWRGPIRPKPGALRHELGLPSLPGLAASREGMEILLRVGLPAVERHVLGLTGYCVEELLRRGLRVHTSPDPRWRAGVIALPVIAGGRVVELLRRRSVDVWTDRSETRLRIDPHVFNNRDDVDRLLEGLDALGPVDQPE